MHGDQLHVILGNWQIVYGIPTYGMIYDRRYPMRPTAAKGFRSVFSAVRSGGDPAQQRLGHIFANTKDELVIDMIRWQGALAPQSARNHAP